MARAPGRHLLVTGVGQGAAAVTTHGLQHPGDLGQVMLQAPETAAGEDRLLDRGLGAQGPRQHHSQRQAEPQQAAHQPLAQPAQRMNPGPIPAAPQRALVRQGRAGRPMLRARCCSIEVTGKTGHGQPGARPSRMAQAARAVTPDSPRCWRNRS